MLFVKKIIEEDLNSKSEEDIVSELRELPQVKEAVERINGENKTAVLLQRDSQNLMVIGGGQNEKYAVYAIFKGKKYFMANKYDVHKEPVELIVAGKKGHYPSRKCLNLQMVLEAAKHFADRGALAQTFNWETQ